MMQRQFPHWEMFPSSEQLHFQPPQAAHQGTAHRQQRAQRAVCPSTHHSEQQEDADCIPAGLNAPRLWMVPLLFPLSHYFPVLVAQHSDLGGSCSTMRWQQEMGKLQKLHLLSPLTFPLIQMGSSFFIQLPL